MSDEIGQDEGFEGEDFEIDEFGQHAEREIDGEEEEGRVKAEYVNGDRSPIARDDRRTRRNSRGEEEEVVFEIGDDDEETPRRVNREDGEYQGLMTSREDNDSKETLVPPRSEEHK